MPKKTRKQKMLAEARKQKQMQTTTLSYTFTTAEIKNHDFTSPSILLIRRDVLKTLLIGSLFIAAEFVLAAASIKLGW